MRPDKTYELIQKIGTVNTKEDFVCLLENFMCEVGLNCYAYAYMPYAITETEKITVIGNYDTTWIKKYQSERLHRIDPVMLHASQRADEFFWDEIPTEETVSNWVIYEESAKFGIEQGFTIPFHGAGLAFSTLNVSSKADDDEFKDHVLEHIPLLKLLSMYAHQKLQTEHTCYLLTTLTYQEKRCMAWMEKGKTYEETAIILSIKTRTVKFHLKNAMQKLDAVNIKQAIAKAIKHGILS